MASELLLELFRTNKFFFCFVLFFKAISHGFISGKLCPLILMLASVESVTIENSFSSGYAVLKPNINDGKNFIQFFSAFV